MDVHIFYRGLGPSPFLSPADFRLIELFFLYRINSIDYKALAFDIERRTKQFAILIPFGKNPSGLR